MLVLAGLHTNNRGFRKPTLENPRCKLVDTSTVLGVPDLTVYECDVARNATNIEILSVKKVDHSLILHEVIVECLE